MLFEHLPISDYELSNNCIDIWQFSLINEPIQASSLLNGEELARANRFYFAHHRRRFIVARAMLRIILGFYLKINPAAILFSYNNQGKPQVKDSVAIEFNLSHSSELALLAIGKQALGIDIEFFSARPYQGIAEHSFSEEEALNLAKLPHYLKPLAFFHIWTQKEAFIKACGLGLSYPTQSFNVQILPPSKNLVWDNKHQKNWQMISFMPRIHCSAALCCEPAIQNLRYTVIDPIKFTFSL